MTYYTTYDNGYSNFGLLASLGIGFWLIYIAFWVVAIIALWKMYEKAGKPGWAVLVPFYNEYVLFEIAGYDGWMFLLLLVPFVNIVFYFLLGINIAKKFGRSTAFGVFLLVLFPIGYLMLGFNKDEYNA